MAATGLGVSFLMADPLLLERVLPLVDYLEVDPEVMAEYNSGRPRIQPSALDLIEEASRSVPVIIHGTGLSIGSYDGYSEKYLSLLDQILERVTPLWHSEHLGFTEVDGEFLGTMLTIPRTEPVVDMICARVAEIQRRYPFPFLLENIIRLLPDYTAELDEAAFLNAIVYRTGCGLLLDLYNLECDAHNNEFDIPAFFDALNMNAVREIHLARGEVSDGLLLDVHSQPTRESTIDLTREVQKRAPNLAVITFELLREAFPKVGIDGLEAELKRLRGALLN